MNYMYVYFLNVCVGFIDKVCVHRGLDIHEIIIRLSVDSGGGSLKYMVNVFGKDDDGERGAGDQYKNTGIVLYIWQMEMYYC